LQVCVVKLQVPSQQSPFDAQKRLFAHTHAVPLHAPLQHWEDSVHGVSFAMQVHCPLVQAPTQQSFVAEHLLPEKLQHAPTTVGQARPVQHAAALLHASPAAVQAGPASSEASGGAESVVAAVSVAASAAPASTPECDEAEQPTSATITAIARRARRRIPVVPQSPIPPQVP
jgi:hypothetical protein